MWPFTRSESRKYTVEVFLDTHKHWHWRIKHVNGQILATSEAYSSRGQCDDTARALGKAASFAVIEP